MTARLIGHAAAAHDRHAAAPDTRVAEHAASVLADMCCGMDAAAPQDLVQGSRLLGDGGVVPLPGGSSTLTVSSAAAAMVAGAEAIRPCLVADGVLAAVLAVGAAADASVDEGLASFAGGVAAGQAVVVLVAGTRPRDDATAAGIALGGALAAAALLHLSDRSTQHALGLAAAQVPCPLPDDEAPDRFRLPWAASAAALSAILAGSGVTAPSAVLEARRGLLDALGIDHGAALRRLREAPLEISGALGSPRPHPCADPAGHASRTGLAARGDTSIRALLESLGPRASRPSATLDRP